MSKYLIVDGDYTVKINPTGPNAESPVNVGDGGNITIRSDDYGNITFDSGLNGIVSTIGSSYIDGDLHVSGVSYGTYPIVKNVLYVTTEGKDTNDGSGLDPTKACRTISGALKSPLYNPGTTIKVAAGHYLEDNPLTMKPYTSIIGNDLRTTSIEPINKTLDLIHVNSSCYIAQMQFINGRSGIIDPNIDRGAFSISFANNIGYTFNANIFNEQSTIDVLTEETARNIIIGMEIIGNGIPIGAKVLSVDVKNHLVTLSSNATSNSLNASLKTGKIVVYKSPYVQNCTNQSGPWLYDGTMFVPNQTVQVPLTVATSTFDNGQDHITVNVQRSSIDVGDPIIAGMTINTAPQDTGFFDARTLMLANLKFIQSQVIMYIAHNYPDLNYNKDLCYRDVGIIVNNVLYDTCFGGNSKSIEAGLAYWNGAVAILPSDEVPATADSLDFIKAIAEYVVQNTLFPASYYLSVTGDFSQNTISNVSTISQIYKNTVISSVGEIETILAIQVGDSVFGDGIPADTIITEIVSNTEIKLSNSTTGIGGQFFIQKQQILNLDTGNGLISLESFNKNIDTVKNIVTDGPTAAPSIYYTTGPTTSWLSAETLIQLNRQFLQEEVKAYITQKIIEGNGIWNNFEYNENLCYRDVGLIVDAISQDTLLGGNSKTVEAALGYFIGNDSLIPNEVLNTIDALTHCYEVIADILMGNPVAPTTGNPLTTITSIVGLELVDVSNIVMNNGNQNNRIYRNFQTLFDIIQNGPTAVQNYTVFSGTSLFAATGISLDDVRQATRVVEVSATGEPNEYLIKLDKPTVGVGSNSTLYFGYTDVYPKIDENVPDSWQQRRVDKFGSMGGMLVDGAVVTDSSPINSMVMDAYTQVNQGGRGIKITNKGYAQLVSVFTIFCSISVEVDKGGICSITNSNSNFGDYCLVSKGYGPREFFGTVYNPVEPLYPNGKFPQNGSIKVYVPDTNNRPHISLLMEVEPPDTYKNAQGKPGFLSSVLTLPTITAGSTKITGVDITGIYIGQDIYIRDQYGRYADPVTGRDYIGNSGTGIVAKVIDLSYQTIHLSIPINATAGDPNNPTYFTVFTCGNAYYTVLSSEIAPRPTTRSDGSILNEGDLLIPPDQKTSELNSLIQLEGYITDLLSADISIDSNTINRVSELFGIIRDIIDNGVNSAPDPVKSGLVNVTNSDGNARDIILANIQTFINSIFQYLEDNFSGIQYDKSKCSRDVELVSRCISDDLVSGGNYNSVYSGISYYSRTGTHHVVLLEESVFDPALFPDGTFINFYQRSYMSASGYLFEYVGSGSNYGALPQVGRFDPVQGREVIMIGGGKVFFTSTDQNGDFRIGPGLVISQATGVLSGRTFEKSLFAQITPFILAIEG